SSAPATVNTAFTYNITATGDPIISYAATGLPASLVLNTTTGVITGTPLVSGVINATLTATNATGTSVAAPLTITVAAAGVAPIITNSPLTAAGTVGTPFSFTITASGLPTSYSAAPRPAGLNINTGTGAITGTPTAVGSTSVLLGATNTTGTGNATLTITVAAAGVAPIITNSPLTAAGTVGTPFSLMITASGLPTSYSAAPLPAGLTVNVGTGAITGTPTSVGTTSVLLGATNATGTGNATLTITIAAAGVAPIITNSPLTAAGTVGTPFGFTITASGLPTSYTATPLPAGLVRNTLTGAITGTPTTVGTTSVLLGASNATGTGNATLTITVAAAGVAPIITNSPLTAAGTVGTPFGFTIIASGLPTSYTATPLPAGLSIVALTGAITGTPTTVGTTSVLLGASNATGTGNATLTITVAAAGVAPIITNNESTVAGTAGTPFNYTITASGLPTSYGASNLPPGLVINTATGVITGKPTTGGTWIVTLTATNATGTSTTFVTITITSSWIADFAARAVSGQGDLTLIVGFIASGDGKQLLIRGVGPTLATQGVSNALADPVLTLYGHDGVMGTNDDWQVTASGQADATLIAATAARVGAAALPNGSKDSALLVTISDGVPTTALVRSNNSSGIALAEIYAADADPGIRLTSVAARMNVTVGEGAPIVGLVIAGDAPKTVLIRGIGPTLTAYGVTAVVADPKIAVFSGVTEIASNDNWEIGTSTADQIIDASSQVGAFPLPAGSKDAALLITLQPGVYTVRVPNSGSATGVVLVEVYDTQ
ncbi:MAG: putative Ig domain-containing protein, partial [Opitutaceae bacterium]